MIYELRVYTALPGRREAMLARFRDHTTRLFEKHGMRNIGYWTNYAGGRYGERALGPGAGILPALRPELADLDVAQRERAWAAFSADPEWREAYEESERDGPIVSHSENRLLQPTDFSPLR